MLAKVLIIVCGILALTHRSWWWWGAGFFFILDRLEYWYYYHSRPWRKLHYPLMKLYAWCAGVHTGVSQATGRDFDIEQAIFMMLKKARPSWSDETIAEFIEHQALRCEKYEDRELIAAELRRRIANLEDTRLQGFLEKARSQFSPSNPDFFIRFIIAGLIENQYGSPHRAEYLLEVVRGRAN
jgi:hypothetical protein